MAMLFSVATARAADGVGDPLNALMMGGTAMPTPSEIWQDTIVADYIVPATGQNHAPVLVPTPEWAANTSIPVGLANLQALKGPATCRPALPRRGLLAERADRDR
jgi:hypothetical protein